MKRILSLIIALVMALGVFACAEDASQGTVLMTVDDEKVYQDQVQEIAELLYQYGYTNSVNMTLGLKYVLLNQVAPFLLTRGQEAELLGEERLSELKETYTNEFNDYFESYVESLAGENDTEEDKAAHRAQAQKDFEDADLFLDKYIADMVAQDAFEVYRQQIDIDVTDAEVDARYMEYIEEEKAYFQGNVPLYENYQRYGYTLYWQPDGYRGIIHILISADEDALNAYKAAAGDEEKAKAAAAVVASVQETLDEIYKALEDGEEFISLIEKYNIDPGMQDEENLKNGYAVHKDSITYVDEFTKGAFADEMQQVGDVSQPVVTSYGVHILYYLRDIPEGAKELTQEFAQELKEELESAKLIEIISEQLRAFPITYSDAYFDVIGDELLP
ncbi:MAG: peptidylprolyl isomerase [Clostridia bacterium]|nr:peptidylprolyl isomerase [Clostridia bacterium]